MMASVAPLAPPVTPNGPTAQQWILDELAKSEYRASQPTWFDRLATAIQKWFSSLTAPTVHGISGLGVLTIVVIVVVVVGVAFLVFGLPRLNRRSRVAGELFGEDDQRTAAQILAAARSAANKGDYSLAVIEGMRAIARTLGERTLVTMFPGTTAHEFSRQAGLLFPAYSDRLRTIADRFDAVRYLGETGSESSWIEVEAVARDLRTAPADNQLVSA